MPCLLCLGFWPFRNSASLPANAWLAQELMRRSWPGAKVARPRALRWPWADSLALARLTARCGDVDLIILSGGDRRTSEFAPTHMASSALPGQIGNTVIAGNHDTHFRFLQEMQVGDLLNVETRDGDQHRYKIIALDVVDAKKGSLVLDTSTAILSLVTGYPFEDSPSGNQLRYVVTAVLLNNSVTSANQKKQFA